MSIQMRFAAIVAATVAIFAGTAGAATYDINRQNSSSFYHFNQPVWTAVKDTSWAQRRYAGVGGYALEATDNSAPSSTWDFTGWCIDILTDIQGDLNSNYVNTVQIVDQAPSVAGYDVSRISLVEKLFEAVYSPSIVLDRIESAGFQLAIWELLYEDSGVFDIRGGDFQRSRWTWSGQEQSYVDDQIAAFSAAARFLRKMNNGPATDYDFKFLVDVNGAGGPGSSQLLIIPELVPPTPVPLPAPALLLLGGVGALAALKRRKAKA